MEEQKLDKVIEDLGTAIMCVNNLLTQEQFIVRDKVINAMIEAMNLIEEQKQQIITTKSALELLKEKEPKQMKNVVHLYGDYYAGMCPECGKGFSSKFFNARFCKYCGQAVKWDG